MALSVRVIPDGIKAFTADNLYSAFYRLAPFFPNDSVFEKKSDYLKKLSENWPNRASKSALAKYYKRSLRREERLEAEGWKVASIELKTQSRLVTGFGYDCFCEAGITLHPLYGFPYLPGSSVKGLAHAWCRIGDNDRDKNRLVIFGHGDEEEIRGGPVAGKVVFFDAIPVTFPQLDLDILTPHFGKYYEHADVPGDWYDPNPTPFLTVSKGSEFRFTVAIPPGVELEVLGENVLDTARYSLYEALTRLGAGGKTASGYGYFERDDAFEKEMAMSTNVGEGQFLGEIDYWGARGGKIRGRIKRQNDDKIFKVAKSDLEVPRIPTPEKGDPVTFEVQEIDGEEKAVHVTFL